MTAQFENVNKINYLNSEFALPEGTTLQEALEQLQVDISTYKLEVEEDTLFILPKTGTKGYHCCDCEDCNDYEEDESYEEDETSEDPLLAALNKNFNSKRKEVRLTSDFKLVENETPAQVVSRLLKLTEAEAVELINALK